MNLLIDPLPKEVHINGHAWAINYEFYIGILFELLMQNEALSDEEKVRQALTLYFPVIPSDPKKAMDAMLWFYRCGKQNRGQGASGQGGSTAKAYCFEQDAELIFAAFYSQYHIDLSTVDNLHWWTFRALFAGLSADSEIKKIMGYRIADLKGMSKAQKKLYEKMRKIYAIKNQRSAEGTLSLVERNQRMRDYVDRRFSEMSGNDSE